MQDTGIGGRRDRNEVEGSKFSGIPVKHCN
jgi:hypothetical protein